jgi:hypothetical protein
MQAAQSVQSLKKNTLYFIGVCLWKLMADAHAHAFTGFREQLGTPAHFLGPRCVTRTSDALGINRVGQGLNEFVHRLVA